VPIRDGLLCGAHLLHEFEADERFLLVEQLLVVEISQAGKLPPDALGLAPMEAEDLGKEPGRLLFRRPTRGIGRHASEQTIGERAEPRVALGQLLIRFWWLRSRPWDLVAVLDHLPA